MDPEEEEWRCPEGCTDPGGPLAHWTLPFIYPPSTTQTELGVLAGRDIEPSDTWEDGLMGVPDGVKDNARTGTDVPPLCRHCLTEAVRTYEPW